MSTGLSAARASTLTAAPVTIGDGSYIGSGATIMPGAPSAKVL
ncbi:MAG: hypothetical protein WBB62_02980 [Rhodococcus sp. (in: high G+C Gram-positive bacteria)]